MVKSKFVFLLCCKVSKKDQAKQQDLKSDAHYKFKVEEKQEKIHCHRQEKKPSVK